MQKNDNTELIVENSIRRPGGVHVMNVKTNTTRHADEIRSLQN